MAEEALTLAEMDQEVINELDDIANEAAECCGEADCDCIGCLEAKYDDGDYSGEDVSYKYTSFVDQLHDAGFDVLDEGSFRSVYARKNIVIKVPINTDGEIDNRVESAAWHKYKSDPTDRGIYLAPCRLLPNGCLMMVQCHFDWTEEERNSRNSNNHWSYKVEGYQVGKYHDRIVAYDYALDISERMSWEKEWGVHSYVYWKRFA